MTTWLGIDEVAEAQNGAEAISRVQDWQPHIVLMDARMPEVDGVEATRAIKAKWPQVRVIVLSIYSEYQADALAAGADLFLGKAEPPERLRAALTRLAHAVDQSRTSPGARPAEPDEILT